MFCPTCGEKNPDGARFCARCGAPFPAPEPFNPAPSPSPVPRRRPRVPLVAGIVAAVVLIAAVGVGVWFAFFSPYPIDEKTFPDPALRAAVAATYDADHDGQLSRDEGRAVTQMTLSGATSLSGLGRIFPNLASLTVTGGALMSLDVSDLGALTSLDVTSEPLATLDVSHNSGLVALRAPDTTQVTGLEATKLHESWVVSSVTEDYGNGYAMTYTAERDDAGRVTARQTSDGDNFVRWEYAYDERGRLASEQEYTVMYGSSSSSSTTYAYDDAGRLVSDESYERSVGRSYTYDDAGRLAEMDMGGVDDVTSTTTYAYDDAGRLASETYHYKSNSGTVTSYTYDDQGNLMQLQSYDETLGVTYETLTYQRDDVGRLTGVSGSYNYDVDSAPVSYAYDGAGRLASATATLDGVTYTAEVTYDERGAIAAIVEHEGARTTVYAPSYTRCFVAEGTAEPSEGIRVGVEEVPLVGAQHMSLVNVWAVPPITPAPQPYAQPGESMIMLF